jgi:HlyD family secretion protein
MALLKKYFWIPLVLVLLGVGGFLTFGRSREAPAVEITAVKAVSGEFVRESKASGNVEARVYALNFPRPGRVARVLVQEGAAVRSGALLATLDMADDLSKLVSARENLAAVQVRLQTGSSEADANRAKAVSGLNAARSKLELARKLFAVGAASRQEVDDATRTVADLESQLRVLAAQTTGSKSDLEAQLAARNSEIRSLERAISQSQLRAPVDGTVAKIDFLTGTESGTGAVRLIEDATLTVRARLSEADAGLVKPGQPARIELDAAQGTILEGKVDRLGAQGEVQGQGGSAILPVVLRFLSNDARSLARPGLTATARITTLRLAKSVTVPLESLLEEDKKFFVWKIDTKKSADGKIESLTAKKTQIKVIARNLTVAAVSGLEAGAQIVNLPPEDLLEGARVKLPPEDSKPGETKPGEVVKP